jgi:hypothetical protein
MQLSNSSTKIINIMKRLLVILFLIGLSKIGFTQCKEKITDKEIAPGMFIYSNVAGEPDKKYYAQILTVDGTNFTCRFSHSSSVYQFTDLKLKYPQTSKTHMCAKVKSSKGGGYKPGTEFEFNVFMADPVPCDLSKATLGVRFDLIATFVADRKSYLGRAYKTATGYDIYFPHSKSNYTTDNNFKVLSTDGGGYIVGSAMQVVHAKRLEFNVSNLYN